MNEIDAIFDAVGKASSLIHREDKLRKEVKHWRKAAMPDCGNCRRWMIKQLCDLERDGNFRTMNSPACSQYEEKHTVAEWRERLSDAQTRLDEFLLNPLAHIQAGSQ